MTNCKQKYLNLVQRISFSMAGSKTNSEGQVIIHATLRFLEKCSKIAKFNDFFRDCSSPFQEDF